MAGAKRHYAKRNRTRRVMNERAERVPKTDEDFIEMEGTVIDQRRGALFLVKLKNGHEILAHTGGKMKRFKIRIMPGDRVTVAITPYDMTKGRITYRFKSPG